MLRQTIILIILFISFIYNANSQNEFHSDTSFFLHTIERGQTVYSISKMYNVSVDDIYKWNPQSKESIQAGSSLKIPQESGSYFYHTIQPKETLYSVSKKYQMKGEDIISVNPGLSTETFTIGKIIRIPINKVTTPIDDKTNENVAQKQTNDLLKPISGMDIKTIKVGLLLPIGLKENTTPQNASTNRMVEYYEGFLLALEDLKKKGVNVDLQIYDIGSKTNIVSSVLKKEKMQDIHILIGGLSDAQIKLMSNFANEKKIPYVIPFTSKSDEPLNNFNVYQINTPQSYLYSKTSLAFCNKYKNANIILYNPTNKAGNKKDFIKILSADLEQKKIPYKMVTKTSDFSSSIDKNKDNVFLTSDDALSSLSQLVAPLKELKEADENLGISIFGYPTWQVYSSEFADDFVLFNASFYSVFYANPTDKKIKSFYNRYNQWFSRSLINTYPKYGILGYDTGMFFIQLLDKYGTSYSANINKLKYHGIQTDFHFERANNWGGFINTNVYFIEFGTNYSIKSNQIN